MAPATLRELDRSNSTSILRQTLCQSASCVIIESIVSTPYCVTACPGRARVFGDVNDPHSEVAKLIAKKHALILPENGIEPSFHYVVS